jgi:NAD(P)-dependent dehydrogenase (short-subunit alcohol dehydrogenase family)
MTRGTPPAVLDKVVETVPLGRIGQPSDVAAMAAFLASVEAGYITDQVMFVCGGYSISTSHA